MPAKFSRLLRSARRLRRLGIEREELERIHADRAARERLAPLPGEPAPDFELVRIAPDGTQGRFQLASVRGRPVALLLGSYTCPIFRRACSGLGPLLTRTGDRVLWLWVYLAEAHPADGWQLPVNVEQGIVHAQPTSLAERAELACLGRRRLGLELPILLDAMDDRVAERYAASPMRFYLLDAELRVAYRSEVGAAGCEPEAWADAIGRLLAEGGPERA